MDQNQKKMALAYLTAVQSAAERLAKTLETSARVYRDTNHAIDEGDVPKIRQKMMDIAPHLNDLDRQIKCFYSAKDAWIYASIDLMGIEEAFLIGQRVDEMMNAQMAEFETKARASSPQNSDKFGFGI